MSHTLKSQAMAMMSKIDDIKDSISDGDYLELCNMLKALNDNIKNYKPIENNDDSEDEQEEDLTLDDIVENFLCSRNIVDVNGTPILPIPIILQKFNNFIKDFEDNETTRNPRQWFYCACSSRVCSNAISEHIQTPEHNNNFTLNH